MDCRVSPCFDAATYRGLRIAGVITLSLYPRPTLAAPASTKRCAPLRRSCRPVLGWKGAQAGPERLPYADTLLGGPLSAHGGIA